MKVVVLEGISGGIRVILHMVHTVHKVVDMVDTDWDHMEVFGGLRHTGTLMSTRGRDRAHSRENRNEQPADNHAEFMVAMTNLANTMEANAVTTLQAMQRLGQPVGNENENGEGNANDNAEGNSDNTGVALMTLTIFLKTDFYKKYFPESAREAKEMELMQLKQGSLLVADYTSKFEELYRFSRVCRVAPKTYESWKCIKYQRGLKDNIMTVVTPIEICTFSDSVNKPRVVEEYAKTVAASKDTHGGNTCGCFNCGLPGHITKDCARGKNPNAGQSQYQGRVFAVNAKDASKADPLMRGICLISDKTLIALYDTGASYSFILFDKVEELGLKVPELAFELHVHTPHQTVMTRSGCRQVGFKLEGRDFMHDLICLPMVGLEIILEFDWLSKNRILLDCFEWSIQFMPEGENGGVVAEGYYLNSVMVHCNAKKCQGYILMTANASGDALNLDQIPIVRDFPEVFPKDIPEFPPQRKIEFAIELVPGTGPLTTAPYRMALIELDELKTQLKELLNKRFIRPSVSPWGVPVLLVKKKDGGM
ncbi:uncharacterized protein LOC107470031 [Arachis duranensis]|uniref:Uncharacterized protein LOC107470031 n=1 Tax=Arachis duranensis TaxID=130453 RepID=A0A9C6TJ70_ARADU|nr:uncharacterized protein LOC107470031 [Arachis duranensis]